MEKKEGMLLLKAKSSISQFLHSEYIRGIIPF